MCVSTLINLLIYYDTIIHIIFKWPSVIYIFDLINQNPGDSKTQLTVDHHHLSDQDRQNVKRYCVSGCQSKPIVKCTLCLCNICYECISLHRDLHYWDNFMVID